MRFGRTENNRSMRNCKYIPAFFILCICAFSVACQSREQKIDAALKSCQEIMDKDDLNGAYQCYLKVGKTYPENDSQIVDFADKSIFRKCVEFKKEENYNQAAFCFEGLIKLRPNSSTIYFQIADSYYKYYEKDKKDNKYPDIDLLNKAENAIKKSVSIEPEEAISVETYGEILSEKDDWQGALREYQKAVKLAPKEGWMWIKLAFSQEKLRQNEEAIKSYQQALTIDSKNTAALYFLGVLYEKLGKLDEAIETIEKQKEVESLNDETEQRLKSLKERRKSEQKQKQMLEKSKAVGSG